MATKRILAIRSVQTPDPDIEYRTFYSRTSLLDYDIILYRPDISKFIDYSDSFNGKPSLGDHASFRLKEACEHWRSEIKQAVEDGKTVVVWLPALQSVYVATGRKDYSGTGRNQKVTRLVEELDYLKSLPVAVKARNSTGKLMRPTEKYGALLKSYIDSFGNHLEFQVILEADKLPVCITTKSGDRAVGALFEKIESNGTLLLLPDIDFFNPDFTITTKDDEEEWTSKGHEFASRLKAFVMDLHVARAANSEFTPVPVWADDKIFELTGESDLRGKLLAAEKVIEEAQRHKEQLKDELASAGRFRALLFENDKPLEYAVLDALKLFGFLVEQFKEGASEFDVVFECAEGRLVGEVEGKDNKPINVDKLRQLTMNIHEDLQRESVAFPAKAVLFGNGYRLLPPDKRDDPFTDKCKTAATSTSTALVSTPDLFRAVQHLLNENDKDFSAACRMAMLSKVGRVVFPTPSVNCTVTITETENSTEA